MITNEILIRAINESKLKQIYSCCGVNGKCCNTDKWQGNLEGFANALWKVFSEKVRNKEHYSQNDRP